MLPTALLIFGSLFSGVFTLPPGPPAATKGESECIPPDAAMMTETNKCCEPALPRSLLQPALDECFKGFTFDIPGPAEDAHHSPVPPNFSCVYECVFNKTGLATDGMLNETRIIEHFTMHLDAKSEWMNVITNAIPICIAFVEEASKPTETCTSGAKQFLHCIFRLTFLNCPASVWNESETCSKLKANMEKCSALPPPPPPHQ